jgi:phosphate transport system protein
MENKLDHLKAQVMTMMDLVRTQVTKAHKAFTALDSDVAREVLHYENRVNALELSIDGDCERLFERTRLRGVELRFALSSLKVNTQLERIGDHADMMARTVLLLEQPYSEELLNELRITDMFHLVILMLNDASQGFNFEEVNFSRRVFTHDAKLREISIKTTPIIVKYAKENPALFEQFLHLTSYIQKMERIGELTKNIAEETVFYLEQRIVRHKDKR